MSVIRGSQHKLAGIAETTFGVTPATPTLLEFPIVNFDPKSSNNTMESSQLRTHPYVDQLIPTTVTHAINTDFELQSTNHDTLISMIMGGAWSTNVVKATDAIQSMTIEGNNNSALYNQFTGYVIKQMDVSIGSGDNAPIQIKTQGMAKAGTLDAGSTIATAVTAAAAKVPMIFTGATATLAGVARPLTNLTFSFQRQIDPLQLIGYTSPREFVPGKTTITGTLTIPYDDNTQSTLFTNFTDAAIALTCASGSSSFLFTIPKTKYTGVERQVNARGAILQAINFEAYYDTSSTTIMSITRVP